MVRNLIGVQIGQYRIVSVLGQGGFATVYRGEHTLLGRQVAVKMLNTTVTGDGVKAFLAEARTITNLEHPHIVRVYDFAIENGNPYLVMEYAPKGSLADFRPKDKPLPFITVLSYIKQVASALQYAHDQKIIHRDVKPQNILMRQNGEILLADFGLALISHTSHPHQTQESIIGTINYMAPEQIMGKPVLATDQYALGVVAYEWFSGQLPFRGLPTEIQTQHINATPPSLNGIVPPDIEQIICRAMAKDPDQRFPHVRDFAMALEQAFQDIQQEALKSFTISTTLPHAQPPIALVPTPPLTMVQPMATTVALFNQSFRASEKVIARYDDIIKQIDQLIRGYHQIKQNLQHSETQEKEALERERKQQYDYLTAEIEKVRNESQSAQTALQDSSLHSMINVHLPSSSPQKSLHTQTTMVQVNELTNKQPIIRSTRGEIHKLLKTYKQRDKFLADLPRNTGGIAISLLVLYGLYVGITALIHFVGPQLPLLDPDLLITSLVIVILILIAEIIGRRQSRRMIVRLMESHFATLIEATTLAEASYTEQTAILQNTYHARQNECQDRYNKAQKNSFHQLQANIDQFKPLLQKYMHEDGLLVARWEDPQWSQWQPPQQTTAATRLGIIAEKSEIPALQIPARPVFVAGPGRENLIIKVPGDAKQRAVHGLQSLMLRLLATQRPGKLRFTLIDPVGLGDRLALFRQLKDYDEEIVGQRIWTKMEHIEHQLALLSEHMEVVIQDYLRNQYSSIEEYNAIAGEIAEPYHVLVILDFPTNFSQAAVHQLRSIFINGPRCGVSTFMLIDTEQQHLSHFNLIELERTANIITCNKRHFVQNRTNGQMYEFDIDMPPPLTTFNYLLKRIGEETKEAHQKVEIPFKSIIERIYPEYLWWDPKNTTNDDILTPLGLSGANKYQYAQLGKGIAHHALVIGTTGSGKTNLFHVLITGLALIYSPDELEFYLVDFKTVGFTPYVTYKLSHARVIAIQSEREFGLSVLRGLDAELEQRKKVFSEAGVQNITPYRRLRPKARMPRILLLIDEFQELFVQKDDIGQQAAMLLDRLVRMGRAFGIHIVLGSQTLTGNYTIDQSTLSQMAVRIAMRCEYADYHLILNEDNTKARLLSLFRPGQAIYNAANGAEAGNSEFQCAWLPEDELAIYLNAIQQLTQHRGYIPTQQQNIFDGSKNADVSQNQMLKREIKAPQWLSTHLLPTIWLGTPIAIQDPTSLMVTPKVGANVLIVGQQEEVASGLLSSALFALAAQHAPGKVLLYVLDFRQEAQYGKYLKHWEEQLPHKVRIINRRKFAAAITEISDIVADRQELEDEVHQPIYLFFYGLQRVRDLRYADGSASLIQQFYTILQKGPETGVHTFVWCDTYTNMQRVLKSELLREFEMRVVLQMTSEDSQQLIGSNMANKLGPHRALLCNGETGTCEKFIPYDLPPNWWLEWTVDRLQKKR